VGRVNFPSKMMLVGIYLMAICGGAIFLFCGGGYGQEKLGVVVSIAPLSEWVRGVGGDKVEVTVLLPPGASPHTYEPKPAQLIKVERARIFVKNGAGLEFWADKIVKINKDILVVDISKEVELIETSSEAKGKLHLLKDPHLWLSLKNAKKGVRQICEALSKVDPENAEYYKRNADGYIEKLDALDREIREKLETIKNKKFIVLHPAWSYFCRDYDLEQVPIEEAGKEPGPKHLMRVIEIAKKNNIKVVFVEPQFNPKSAQVIAREIGGQVKTVDPLAGNYLENMRTIADELARCLK